MSPAHKPYDAVVIGGGPAGAAAAIALARTGRRVLLADSIGVASFKVGEALPPAARPLLRDLGVTAVLEQGGHLRSPGSVAAWGDDELVDRNFTRETGGDGWHLDRPRFDAGLRDAAAAAGAEVRLDCPFARWCRHVPSGHWQLQFSRRGESLHVTSPWVIDATGRRALIASHYGGPGRHDDSLIAFCTVLPEPTDACDARTFVESCEEGWWYSALLPAGRRMVAFYTDPDLVAAQEIATPDGFAGRLAATRHIASTTGVVAPAGLDRIRRFPAGSVSRAVFGDEGWLAVGDASLAFDPLSSQGIFHALYTGLRGAQVVLACSEGDRTPLSAWNDRLHAIHAAYRRHLAQCYAAETRWADAPFWHRRFVRSEPAPVPAAAAPAA